MAVAGEPVVWCRVVVGGRGTLCAKYLIVRLADPNNFSARTRPLLSSSSSSTPSSSDVRGVNIYTCALYSFVLYYFILNSFLAHFSSLSCYLYTTIIIFCSVLQKSFWSSAVNFFLLKIINNDYRVYMRVPVRPHVSVYFLHA